MKLLLVEDDPLILLVIEDVLQDAGHSVLSASSAESAITHLETETDISLVFTDIDLPGMNGLQLAAHVRKRWSPVGIVIASGMRRPGPDEMPDNAVFLPKPYLSKDVLQAIARFES